ncbi:histone deacetylase family protein [Candidatus Undinarchaeota archaeon]
MKVDVVYSPEYLKHTVGEFHPEIPERLVAVWDEIDKRGLREKINLVAPESVDDAYLERVHSKALVDLVRRQSHTGEMIDGDTDPCSKTFEVAKLAVGGLVKAVELVKNGSNYVFCLVRPPGHHATKDRAMGFCYFNNIAFGARAFEGKKAILDVDIHHGNGTQDIFYSEPVLYCSLHQYPFYPGTGGEGEIGEGEGEGYTFNIPLPGGTGDEEYLGNLDRAIERIEKEEPEILFVSVGFDGHSNDPIGGFNLSTDCFVKIFRRLKKYNLVIALEGGYSLETLGECVCGIIEELAKP